MQVDSGVFSGTCQVADSVAVTGPAVGLTMRDLQFIAFERQWWKHPGSKETAILELFGLSATRYYQILNALLDSPAALATDPMLVKRLRRTRAGRLRTGDDARTLGANQG